MVSSDTTRPRYGALSARFTARTGLQRPPSTGRPALSRVGLIRLQRRLCSLDLPSHQLYVFRPGSDLASVRHRPIPRRMQTSSISSPRRGAKVGWPVRLLGRITPWPTPHDSTDPTMSSNGPVSRPASNAAPTAAPAPTAAAAAAPSDTPTSSPTTPGWRVMPDVAWRPRWPPTWFKDPGRFCELESIRQWVKDFFLYKWVPLGDGSYVLRRFKVRERTLSGDATEVSG